MSSLTRQRGATLIVTLVMLTIITLLALSATTLNTTELRVFGNLQNKARIESDAQQAIEDLLSDAANFNTPAAQNVAVNGTAVAISAPTCLGVSQASGYTAVWNVTLYDTNWSVDANVTDPVTGAAATVTQGVRIRTPSNYCP